MQVRVNKDNVEIYEKDDIHEGEYRVNECTFEFSEEYTGLTKKAIFESLTELKEVPIISDKCIIPAEILNSGDKKCNLRVYAYDVNNDELVLRYSPSYDEFAIYRGSYIQGASGSEEITPTQFEQYTNALNQGLIKIGEEIDKAEETLERAETSIEEANNLNIDVYKEGTESTIELTKKDGSKKTVKVNDGVGLDFNWQDTSLGVKREDEQEYQYTNLKGEKGDCEFATFDIDFDTGELVMNKTTNLLIDFFLNEEEGELYVTIPRTV